MAGPGIECKTFVDDRSFWGVDPAALLKAKRRSDVFDQAFCFTCASHKCHLAFKTGSATGIQIQRELDYHASPMLDLLGLSYDLDSPGVILLTKFNI